MGYNDVHYKDDLLTLSDWQVMPYLERVGKRLEPGVQCWPHVLVIVETEQREHYTRFIAYVDAAMWEAAGYSVPEGVVAFDVPPRALVPYAPDALIVRMYHNGLLRIWPDPNMPEDETKIIELAIERRKLTRQSFDAIRVLVGKEFSVG